MNFDPEKSRTQVSQREEVLIYQPLKNEIGH
jgi:hypothetical protein